MKKQDIKPRFEELDSLRGFAALSVVFFHFTMGRESADWGFRLGTAGVDLFFMISGFVILLSLEHIKKTGHFVINRISRLYPTYWASVTLTFAVIVLYSLYNMDFSKVSIIQYLGNLTMFQYYLGIQNIDGPYWTLIIEMLFYIFMAILFQFKFLKHLNKIGVVLTIFIVLLTFLYISSIRLQMVFNLIPLLQFWPLFFAGILFYQIVTKKTKTINIYGMIVLCFIAQITVFEYAGRSKSFITIGEYALMLIFFFSLFALFVNGKLKFIINKPSLFLGKISYALYLIHQKISLDYIIPFLIYKLKFPFWFSAAVALFCCIGIAATITYFIEIPYSRKMKNKLYGKFYKTYLNKPINETHNSLGKSFFINKNN